MKKIISFTICMSIFLFLVSCSKSKPEIKYGMWQIKATTKMKGAPFKIPPVTYKQCMTEENFVPTNKSNNDCNIKEQKVSGNKVTWKANCKTKGVSTSGSGEVIYNNDTLKGTFEMTTNVNGKEMKMAMEMTGKRTGDCKK